MSYYLEALKKYAVFHGRAHRAEFWWFVLFNAIFSYALNVTFGASVGVPEESISSASPQAVLPAIYGLAMFLRLLASASAGCTTRIGVVGGC